MVRVTKVDNYFSSSTLLATLSIITLSVFVILLWNKTNNLQNQFDNGTLTNDQGWSVEIQPPDIISGISTEAVMASYSVDLNTNGKTLILENFGNGFTGLNLIIPTNIYNPNYVSRGFTFYLRNIETSPITITANGANLAVAVGSACAGVGVTIVPANTTAYVVITSNKISMY